MTLDPRGLACGTSSAAACAHAEQALWRMMSFYDAPLADLDAAIAEDPSWALPHLMKAGFLLSLTEPALVEPARAHLQQAQGLEAGATPRERAHLAALQQAADGRWTGAVRLWDDWLIDNPRDALALQWAHLWDFYRGDAAGLRGRPARALRAWDESDPLFAHVLALHAFGLEECNLHSQAEDCGRRALSLQPRSPWAVHAVAHVMEMQGRVEEGATWLRHHQGIWAEGNGFCAHLWWHQALFRLEVLDTAGALRIVDKHLSGAALQITLQRVDAAALLWRLHLLGEEVQALASEVCAGWDLDDANAGYYAFNDVHAILALLLAGERQRAESWVARCAQRAMTAEDSRRSNHPMAREVGLPMMRALLLLHCGEAEACVQTLYPVRAQAQAFGGSHAQRDLIDQTLMHAASLGHHRAVGQALLSERALAKPSTPLTRLWTDRLQGKPVPRD